MTHQREIERLLDTWLSEGSTVAPDRVIDAVADRIERQPQWPAWLLIGRERHVNPTLRIAAAVAAIAILGAGAVYLIGLTATPNVGGPPSAPPESAVPSEPGPSQRSTASRTFQPGVRLELPEGWIVASDDLRTYRVRTTASATSPAGGIELRSEPQLGDNTGDCDGSADPAAGTSPTEILDALSRVPRFRTSPAGTASVDGVTLDAIDVRLAPNWTGSCPWSEGEPAGVLLTVSDPPGGFVGLRGTEVIRVVLLDVDGVTVSVNLSPDNVGDFDAFMSAAMPVVESLVFVP